MNRLFDPSANRRVFGIAPGCDFSQTLIDGLHVRLSGGPPEAMGKVTLFTNTRRAQRRIEEVLTSGPAQLTPTLRAIADIAKDPRLTKALSKDGSAISRRLVMMQAVRGLLESGVSLAPPSAAFDLAGSLNALLDELDGEGLGTDIFETIETGAFSEHWKTSLAFLKIIDETSLAEGLPVSGTEAAQRLAVIAMAQEWQRNPPNDPVLVVGSTGSRGTTALLMQAVLNLPQGAIILPGFDFDLPQPSWQELSDPKTGPQDHPQFGFAQLAGRLGFAPGEVTPWTERPPASAARNRFVSLALRPAPVTNQWLEEGPAFAPQMADVAGGLSLLEAPNERFEAAAIAVALREAAEMDKRAVLITPDATLSRRVTADLRRWNILPDDSAGVPLRFTAPGILFSLFLSIEPDRLPSQDFLSILNHPLCASGWDRGAHLELVRMLDIKVLRNAGPTVDWPAVLEWGDKVEQGTWAQWLKTGFDALATAKAAPLSAFANAHSRAASILSAGPDPSGTDAALWDMAAGEKMRELFEALAGEDAAAGLLTSGDYRAVFSAMLNGETVRDEGFLPDKRIAIWGQLEARVQGADLVILGGLNEDTWPKLDTPDPWLNRPARAALGLQLPERRIGLSAHDFQQAIANSEVILSRSRKKDNTPTVASRWLNRLENLMQGLGEGGQSAVDQMRDRGKRYLELASALDVPSQTQPRAPRPAPAPPVDMRPATVSVTQVERLVRDPFSIYAEKILRLRPLPQLGRSADARDRGVSFHKVFEKFIAEIEDHVPDNAADLLLETAARVLEADTPWKTEQRIWLGRLRRVANSFVEQERTRREIAQPHLRETKARLTLSELERDIQLVGTADRIDRADDGSVAIYDYKSSLPTDKQARLFSKQLHLEANLAIKGGFEDLGRAHAKHLELIGLSKPGDIEVLDCTPELLGQIWDQFITLISYFEDPENGYAARLRPMFKDGWDDFDQLARRGEWEDSDTPVVTRLI